MLVFICLKELEDKREFYNACIKDYLKIYNDITSDVISMEGIELAYEDSGRPIIVKCGIKLNYNISISHSSKATVVALSDKNIGIDIEHICKETDKKLSKIASRLGSYEMENNIIKLYHIWCEKEAYAKYIGTGVTKGILKADNSTLLKAEEESGEKLKFSVLNYIKEYCIVICHDINDEIMLVSR